MFPALAPGAIGVSVADLESSLKAARTGGFQGVEVSPSEIADRVDRQGPEAVVALFKEAGVRPAGWGLPTQWRGSENEFSASLKELPRLARACAAIGATRTFTWILPMSDDLELADNRKHHVNRLKPVSEVLAEGGCRFGMEFIGPKTLRDKGRFPFIYRAVEMLDMAAEMGPNVGLLLDAWHWYTSGDSLADLGKLTERDVVYVHVNDAPAGIERDQQVDNRRSLPGETGVIDIKGFLDALRKMGYDGPIVPEPFKSELGELGSDEERLRVVGESMRRIMG